jgi:VIT1/CCC1 family predicted Fe2+/Mn2+ transporter
MQNQKEEVGKAIFGSFDGMTCVLGIIAAGYISGDTHALVLAAIGLAIAEAVAMSGGTYLSEVANVDTARHACIIGIAAFIGVLLPVLPFIFLPFTIALIASIFITIALATAIAQVRISESGVVRAYAQTFAILVVAAAASILVTLALNKMGVAA